MESYCPHCGEDVTKTEETEYNAADQRHARTSGGLAVKSCGASAELARYGIQGGL